jgi:hypothetical protein
MIRFPSGVSSIRCLRGPSTLRVAVQVVDRVQILDRVPEVATPVGVVTKTGLIDLPNELLITICENLDGVDLITLALSCKHTALITTTYFRLSFPSNIARRYQVVMPNIDRHFLKKRLGDSYFAKHQRYCWTCKRYLPRPKGYWQQKLSKEDGEGRCVGGRVVNFNAWWALRKTQRMFSTWSKGRAFKCPYCRLVRNVRPAAVT